MRPEKAPTGRDVMALEHKEFRVRVGGSGRTLDKAPRPARYFNDVRPENAPISRDPIELVFIYQSKRMRSGTLGTKNYHRDASDVSPENAPVGMTVNPLP